MPRYPAAALLALALFACACAPARRLPSGSEPGLRLSVAEDYYDVAGATARDLNRELSRRGPRHEGAAWQGRTDFRLAYSFVPEDGPDGCRASDARVTVRLVTLLPRWKDRERAPSRLRGDWDLYLARLRDHEEGHRRIAIGAGRDLLAEVTALAADDCAALRVRASAVAEALRFGVADEQRDWDETTQHGLAVGD